VTEVSRSAEHPAARALPVDRVSGSVWRFLVNYRPDGSASIDTVPEKSGFNARTGSPA
jgi:hypothetical protein